MMPPIPLSPPPSLSFPLHSPIQLFLLPATFAPPYKYPSTSRATSFLRSSSKPSFFPTSFPYSVPHQNPNQEPTPTRNQYQDQEEEDDDEEDDRVLGDCLVFEEGAFEDDVAPGRARAAPAEPAPESLVPEKWKEIVDEINLTKKEKRKIAHELKFGSKMERRKKSPAKDAEEYMAYRELKLSQLKPVVLDDPKELLSPVGGDSLPAPAPAPEGRVAPRNPKAGLAKRSLEDISKFFSSGRYVPGEMDDDKKPRSQRKLFTMEEKVLLNKRIPNLVEATSSKWLPLHTLAASGEFYLLDALLKHNVDINAVDKDGLAAIHKAILCKKQAIINFLLRNSANPFIRDQDGATLIHYAVQTASSQTIKILVLYNVDINLADHDGWTPLHLAVQIQRTDIVRLLLIKGADRNIKNRDGLTPLDLCFYLGHDMITYELIKLLKGLPVPKPVH